MCYTMYIYRVHSYRCNTFTHNFSNLHVSFHPVQCRVKMFNVFYDITYNKTALISYIFTVDIASTCISLCISIFSELCLNSRSLLFLFNLIIHNVYKHGTIYYYIINFRTPNIFWLFCQQVAFSSMFNCLFFNSYFYYIKSLITLDICV